MPVSKKIHIISIFLILLSGCIIVKKDNIQDDTEVVNVQLSPKPTIEMSDEYIRSKKGDMIAFLPKDWFLVDVSEKSSPEIFAVAVNPDYNLSLVFSNLRITEAKSSVIKKEGLLGLARLSFDKRAQKTGGSVKQVGKYNLISIGPQLFAEYEFTTAGSTNVIKTAVFVSSIDEYYEFSIVPMNIRNNQRPSFKKVDEIFNSVLATIQY
ncbi:MAG: hypothetical protein N2319_03645 [Candidatus Kapabacteria bacterium]|nr:hypothetical protein [Candidatus Kapabacteria bacterium]